MRWIILTSAVFPVALLAAGGTAGGNEIWKLSGVTKSNVEDLRHALESAEDVSTATIDLNTGNVVLRPDTATSIDDKDVLGAVAKFRGVTITKLQD